MTDLNDIRNRISNIRDLVNTISAFDEIRLQKLANSVIELFRQGNKIAFVGNGGSAAEAMHLAAEFTGKCISDHVPLPALCLNESQSSLTAISNDYGANEVFARMVEAHLRRNDLLIALSTSGSSENIVKAMHQALKQGVVVILWTGINSPNYPEIETWKAPSSTTPRIQEIHLMWGHILAEVVELSFRKSL